MLDYNFWIAYVHEHATQKESVHSVTSSIPNLVSPCDTPFAPVHQSCVPHNISSMTCCNWVSPYTIALNHCDSLLLMHHHKDHPLLQNEVVIVVEVEYGH